MLQVMMETTSDAPETLAGRKGSDVLVTINVSKDLGNIGEPNNSEQARRSRSGALCCSWIWTLGSARGTKNGAEAPIKPS
jgi:hypothetical protein